METFWVEITAFRKEINDIKLFRHWENADKHFYQWIKDLGKTVEDGDEESYEDGQMGYYYWWDGGDNEIILYEVELQDVQ